MERSIDETLTRGVAEVLPSRDDLAALMKKKKIRLYLGIDPTGNQLHLGHAVVLRKLQQFVELGCDVILLIGNGTVKIGDPTGKDKTRPMLTEEQINEHFKTWKDQASKILDFSKITIKRNGDWLDKLTFVDMVKLMATTTVQQLLERDMFQERLKSNLPIHAHELIYPLAQGYDSVAMEVDLEIGGSDQIFNMMVGRQLMKTMLNREKFVLGTELLVGNDGRKMGKSLNNFIPLTATPEDMFGKLMSVVDDVIPEYFRLLTDLPLHDVDEMQRSLKDGSVHPMELKKRLARTITAWLHDEQAAKRAQDVFEKTVQHGEAPSSLTVVKFLGGATASNVVVSSGVATSNSEARRLIEQGGVEVNQKKITDPQQTFDSSMDGATAKIGRRGYFKLEMDNE